MIKFLDILDFRLLKSYIDTDKLYRNKFKIESLDSQEGKLLPDHPEDKYIQMTDIGKYRTKNYGGKWGPWRFVYGVRPQIKKSQINIILVECILGRKLKSKEEESDHIDGDPTNNVLNNVQPLVFRFNKIKGNMIRMITSIINNEYKVYINALVAGLEFGFSHNKITGIAGGERTSHMGYKFRYSSVEEINGFFDKVDEIKDEDLEGLINDIDDGYELKNLMKKQYELNMEWKKGLDKFYN